MPFCVKTFVLKINPYTDLFAISAEVIDAKKGNSFRTLK